MFFLILTIFFNDIIFSLIPNSINYLSTLFLIILLIIIFFFDKNKNLSIRIPKVLFIIFLFFILNFFISFFNSVDKKKSLISLLDYTSFFFISIYAFNFKNKVIKKLFFCIRVITAFSIVFFLINIFFPNKFFPPCSLVYRYNHSQIGNFFIIPFFFKYNPLFLFLIILNSSRSGLISIVLVYFLKFIKEFKNNKVDNNIKDIFYIVILIISLIIISFKKNNFFGNRINYFLQGINFLIKKPLGVGLGNFYDVSMQMSQNRSDYSISSHNFLIDLSSELGIFILIPFILLYVRIFKIFLSYKKKDKELFYVFFALTAIFLFDYSFIFNSFKLIYFLVLGLLIKDKIELKFNLDFIFYSIYLFFVLIILSDIFVNLGHFKLAFIINPFNNLALEKYLSTDKSKKDNFLNKKLKKYLYFLKNNYSGELNYLLYQKNNGNINLMIESFSHLIYKYPAYTLDYLPGYIKLLKEKNSRIDYEKIERLFNDISEKYFFKNKDSEVFKKLKYYCARLELIKCINL